MHIIDTGFSFTVYNLQSLIYIPFVISNNDINEFHVIAEFGINSQSNVNYKYNYVNFFINTNILSVLSFIIVRFIVTIAPINNFDEEQIVFVIDKTIDNKDYETQISIDDQINAADYIHKSKYYRFRLYIAQINGFDNVSRIINNITFQAILYNNHKKTEILNI